MPSSPDDLSVSDAFLEATRRGDARAWEQLVQHYRPYLFAVAMRSLDSRTSEECSSLVQTGLCKAFEQIGQFRGSSRRELLGWLATIVSNKAKDRQRARKASPLPSDGYGNDLLAASDTTPSGDAARRERAARILECLERLPPDYRQIIQYRIFEDLSYEHIAARMERTNDAVRCLWVRALRRLREEFGGEP